MTKRTLSLVVNGEPLNIEIDVRESLLEVLRNKLLLTGTKKGCEVGECGACTVLIDGEPVDSCVYLAVWADGKDITTIEGLAKDGKLSILQESFIEAGAVQCGFCTPGFLMTAHSLLLKKDNVTEEEIKEAMAGNLCRCTGYHQIIDGVKKASARLAHNNK
ncbi:MAG: xanthine dehydrogenase [Desulfitibacter sp. BRH_c19]|nr:MAG: xanthine dehydrogenase [Desulfitibacter sp. BRH_c19]